MRKLLLIILFLIVATVAAGQVSPFSAKIDAVLEKQYKTSNVQPKPFVNEETFVRRAYLSIIGRNPTFEEYSSYQKVTVANKRFELIKFLLKHPGYTSNLYNFWADTLRLRERLNNLNNFNGGPYIDYIKDCIAANKPYNVFVKDLLLSNGSYYDNPATGYYYRDLGMPLDNLIGTGKVFLGTDIGCAQCHDDPFQDFTQRQFYEMAAMFNQIELRDRNNKEFREKFASLRKEVDELIKADPMKNRGLNNQINNFVRATQASLEIQPEKQMKLPHDYNYKDAKPLDVVAPKTLDGKGSIVNKQDLRLDAVNWMVNPSHPTFTKNIVNRYWKWVFGKYIIEEFDNIHDSQLLNSELMNILANIFIEVKYDTREFLYALYCTKLFHREMYEGAFANAEKFVFIGPVKQRLTAEQIWDSVISIANEKPENFTLEFHTSYAQLMKTGLEQLTVDGIKKKVEEYNTVMRGKYEKAPKLGNIYLVRASEINDQNPANTALEQLGRSDRELIQTSSLDGSVTQVISFMNGQLASIAINPKTVLATNLAGKSPSEKIDMIFKSVLARKPTIDEKSSFAGVQDDDIIWALVNSTEFKFQK